MTISNSQKIQDFRQQYRGTYLKRNTKDQEVVYINAILDDGNVQIVNLKNNTTAIIDAYDNQGIIDYTREFSLEVPKAGIYYADGDVLFLKRTAKRQWVKGLGENNYTLISISKQRPILFSGRIAQDLFSEWLGRCALWQLAAAGARLSHPFSSKKARRSPRCSGAKCR